MFLSFATQPNSQNPTSRARHFLVQRQHVISLQHRDRIPLPPTLRTLQLLQNMSPIPGPTASIGYPSNFNNIVAFRFLPETCLSPHLTSLHHRLNLSTRSHAHRYWVNVSLGSLSYGCVGIESARFAGINNGNAKMSECRDYECWRMGKCGRVLEPPGVRWGWRWGWRNARQYPDVVGKVAACFTDRVLLYRNRCVLAEWSSSRLHEVDGRLVKPVTFSLS